MSELASFFMAVLSLGILALLLWVLYIIIFPRPGVPMVCTNCGHLGPTKTAAKGHIGFEIVLWLCFILPGFLYSVWRMSTKRQVCTECGSDHLVWEKSPVGRRLVADLNSAP